MQQQSSYISMTPVESLSSTNPPLYTRLKDPGSALTHGIAAVAAIFALYPLLHKTLHGSSRPHILAVTIFIVSMIALYSASTLYHSVRCSAKRQVLLRKLDHSMIFILIAGSYTPVCRIVLPEKTGIILLSFVWGLSIVGILFKLFWINCPKYLGSCIYIGLGWSCIFALVPLFQNLSLNAFLLLLGGGILYTIGGIIYAIKPPVFQIAKYFGNHEVFHVFVMLGSLCHFLLVYLYLV